MSEVTLSRGELDFLTETIELVLEELAGVEEATECDYILTTGAKEQCEELLVLVNNWYAHLHKEIFIDED